MTAPTEPAPKARGTRLGAWLRRNAPLLGGIAVCQVGMILFNMGLTYGFTRLGAITGRTLPAAYLELPYKPDSPYYSYAGGLVLLLVVVFVLGVLATRGEPALHMLGRALSKLLWAARAAERLPRGLANLSTYQRPTGTSSSPIFWKSLRRS